MGRQPLRRATRPSLLLSQSPASANPRPGLGGSPAEGLLGVGEGWYYQAKAAQLKYAADG